MISVSTHYVCLGCWPQTCCLWWCLVFLIKQWLFYSFILHRGLPLIVPSFFPKGVLTLVVSYSFYFINMYLNTVVLSLPLTRRMMLRTSCVANTFSLCFPWWWKRTIKVVLHVHRSVATLGDDAISALVVCTYHLNFIYFICNCSFPSHDIYERGWREV